MKPTRPQRALLEMLADGDWIRVLGRDRYTLSDWFTVPKSTMSALRRHGWIELGACGYVISDDGLHAIGRDTPEHVSGHPTLEDDSTLYPLPGGAE